MELMFKDLYCYWNRHLPHNIPKYTTEVMHNNATDLGKPNISIMWV